MQVLIVKIHLVSKQETETSNEITEEVTDEKLALMKLKHN